MDVLRKGFSEDQLKGLDFDALLMAYGQHRNEAPVSESKIDGIRTPDGRFPEPSTVKKMEALSQDINLNGYLRKSFRPASADLNGHHDPQHRTTTVASSLSTRGDGVIPIAIVGMSCRFPGGARNIEKLWESVSEGRSAWSKVPESRFNVDAFYHPNSDRTDSVRS